MQVIVEKEEHFLSAFARWVGATVDHGRVNIPAAYGEGYVFGYLYEPYIRLIIRNYRLKEDVVIHRGAYTAAGNMIVISFHDTLKGLAEHRAPDPEKRPRLPSVVVTTQGLDPELYIPGNTPFNTIKLALDAAYVRRLLGTDPDHDLLRNIIDNSQPLVFEHVVSAKLQEVAQEMSSAVVKAPLHELYFKVKCEEMLCCLLMDLMERQEGKIYAIDPADIQRIYAVREKLLEDLSNPPPLNVLADYANMSLSKLKRLFKQVYGNNVYAYYQDIRLEEAARLLKDQRLSVTETGYRLGFSNLSHFARAFEAKFGVKPKKYSIL